MLDFICGLNFYNSNRHSRNESDASCGVGDGFFLSFFFKEGACVHMHVCICACASPWEYAPMT